jgi:putative DNA methylase
VSGLVDAGILEAKGGNVRLLGRADLAADWDPGADARFTVWEATQHLARALETTATDGAATLLTRIGERAGAARDLAYRLYLLCERNKWAEEGLAYNALVVAWPEITERARTAARAAGGPRQGQFDL